MANEDVLSPEAILRFWTEELETPRAWWSAHPDVDAAIIDRFAYGCAPASAGAYHKWLDTPRGALALILLLDQFPRNAFRGTARAFAYDAAAVRNANAALKQGHDLAVEHSLRPFFYLPLEHSESISDQNRAVALFEGRLAADRNSIFHAHAHREVIRRFGRFPHRNAILGRASTPEEAAFLVNNGYNPLK